MNHFSGKNAKQAVSVCHLWGISAFFVSHDSKLNILGVLDCLSDKKKQFENGTFQRATKWINKLKDFPKLLVMPTLRKRRSDPQVFAAAEAKIIPLGNARSVSALSKCFKVTFHQCNVHNNSSHSVSILSPSHYNKHSVNTSSKNKLHWDVLADCRQWLVKASWGLSNTFNISAFIYCIIHYHLWRAWNQSTISSRWKCCSVCGVTALYSHTLYMFCMQTTGMMCGAGGLWLSISSCICTIQTHP